MSDALNIGPDKANVACYSMHVAVNTDFCRKFADEARAAGYGRVSEFRFELDGKVYELSAALLIEALSQYEVKP